ncbi:MAG: hypothetical protein GY749_14115 [Desulfobacteraceae bacterium]|nr:hypothetical protein [Desulfobacteraceae bacterium]
MIKIQRTDIPKVLKENQQIWSAELNNLIRQYGSYSDVPKKERYLIVNNHRHPEIQDAVIQLTEGKCAFCEGYIEAIDYTNIEHFYPKKLYPKFIFKWSNLFPACRKCNIPKGTTDTRKLYPIVNPEVDEPEEYFVYRDLKIETSPTSPDKTKSDNTLKYCNLRRLSLCRSYAKILMAFYEVEEKLDEYCKEYSTLKQRAAKLRKVANILDALDNLKDESGTRQAYAGFLRYQLRNSETVQTSIQIVNSHKNDLKLAINFELY